MIFSIIVLFKKNHEVKVSFKNFKLNGAIIKNIYAVGLPSIIMQSIGAIMMLGINTIFMTAGSAVSVTVFGIYFKLQSFVFMPCFGLNQGVMPVIGYNYGARNRKRVYSALKWGLIIAVIIMSVGVLLMWLIPDVLISMFGGGQELMKVGVPAFKTVSLCFLPAAAGILFTTLFQAVGKGVRSLLMVFLPVLQAVCGAAPNGRPCDRPFDHRSSFTNNYYNTAFALHQCRIWKKTGIR